MSETSTTSTSNWLWRTWRLLVIPISYPIFVVGSLMLLAMVPVAWLLHRSRENRTRWLRQALHRGAQLWLGFNQRMGILNIEVEDNLQSQTPASDIPAPDTPLPDTPLPDTPLPDTPLIVIANHPSLIDVLLITAAVPNLCCVMKGALHYNPLFTILIQQLDYLPNSDPELMLAQGSARLAAGERLLIFPEGTRTSPADPSRSGSPAPLEFRFGAAELALRSGAATLPITIHSNTAYLSKGYPWYRWPGEMLRYRLELGPTLPPCEKLPPGGNQLARRKARRALNDRWQKHFAQRLEARGVGN